MKVWLVWIGEWEAVLEDIFVNEADARKFAHELSKGYSHVVVEEREAKESQ